jgi:hypothetical protein
MTQRGPRRSITAPIHGVKSVDTRKPTEKAPAVRPRSQPNSSRIGGNRSENDVRALTPRAMVTNAMATTTQP